MERVREEAEDDEVLSVPKEPMSTSRPDLLYANRKSEK